ncbi:serine/threonine-protein kinase [Roseibium alexandrii]|uniref:serine/threonine-protein kinase n=1 Tax=Roseibium alexandrii TaxID=388408 RepID=UPI003752F9AA
MNEYVANLVVGHKIGSGHFGDVHLAEDQVHGKVAVKIIRQKETQSDQDWTDEKTEFLAEAQNLASAAHPNIVPVYHLLESADGKSLQYCMKLCAGGSLQDSYESGPMNFASVRKIGTEVLLGLDALHARGMIHRDIKPGNILIDEFGIARIGDFGLVTDNLLFGYANAAGYSDHLAFEVWERGLTSVRSDIWAFGMTLYRLLHGQSWYSETQLPRYSIADGDFNQKLRWLPHVPRRWRRAIRSMMVDDPANRLQTVGQAQAAFSGLPVEPDWTCRMDGNCVHWQRNSGSRTIRVDWKRHSPRRHEWKAWSEPSNGIGQVRTLAGSNGIIGLRQAIRELEDFFSV